MAARAWAVVYDMGPAILSAGLLITITFVVIVLGMYVLHIWETLKNRRAVNEVKPRMDPAGRRYLIVNGRVVYLDEIHDPSRQLEAPMPQLPPYRRCMQRLYEQLAALAKVQETRAHFSLVVEVL